MDAVGILVVPEVDTHVVSDRLVMALVICLDHSRYPLVAGGKLPGQVKNMVHWVVIENTQLGSMELGLVVRELGFDVVVWSLGMPGLLCARKVW